MTTDSPKGPEREARPSKELLDYLRRLLGQRFDELLATANFLDEDDQASTLAVFEDVLPLIGQEIANRAAAYDLMMNELRGQRAVANKYALEQQERADQSWAQITEARAEVSRLREQLAAQQPADIVERAAIWLFRAKTSRLLPDVLQRALASWHQVLDQHDRDAWSSYAREMLMDLGWGVSSSEVEAPEEEEEERATPHWREGDIAIDQSNFVHRRFEHGWRTWPRESGLQYGDALMESGFGPMLRLDEVPAETDSYGHVPVLVAERVRAAQAARSGATPKWCQYVTRRAIHPDWVCLLPFGHGDDHEVGPPSLRKEGEDRQPRVFHFGDAVEPRDIDRLRDEEGDVWERRDTGQWHCLDYTACPPLYFQRLLHDFGPLTEVLPSVSSQEEKKERETDG